MRGRSAAARPRARASPGGDGVSRGRRCAVRLAGGVYRELALDGAAVRRRRPLRATSPRCPADGDAWATLRAVRRARRDEREGARRADRRATAARRSSRCRPRGAGRGAAARIAFTAPTDGWMVTNAGWLFHYSDGRTGAGARHRPGVRAADRVPPERGGRAVRPRRAAGRRLAAVRAAAARRPAVDRHAADARQAPEGADAKVSKPRVDRRLRLHLAFTLRRRAKVALDREAPREGRRAVAVRLLTPGAACVRAAAGAQALAGRAEIQNG